MKNDNEIAKLWDEAARFSEQHVYEFEMNHSFLEGRQWLQWNPSTGLADTLPEDSDHIQATMNRMRSNDRSIMAELVKEPLSFENLPSAADDATLRAAKIGESILEDLRMYQDWEVIREDHIQKTRKGGTALLATDWSATTGTAKVVALSVKDFVFEPGASDPERGRWWIKRQTVSPMQAQAMFPKQFPNQAPTATRSARDNMTLLSVGAPPETVTIYTYYERPNPMCVAGKIRTEVGGSLVQEADWPFPWSHRLNFAVARETLSSGAYGTTSLSDVRSPQVALNLSWSTFLEHVRQVSTHRITAGESWGDVLGDFSDDAGEVLLGDTKDGRPEYMKAPSAPPATIQAITNLELVIDDLMGIHDVRRGEAPANIESGYGIQLLTENDATPGGRLLGEVARVWSITGWMVLELNQTEVTTKRKSATGEKSTPSRREWKGSDLLGQTNAKIQRDAIIPKSRATQMQFAQEAIKMGLLNGDDPLVMVRFAQLSQMRDQSSIINATLPDAAKAIRENEAFVMDQAMVSADFDDHEIHIALHNDFRKTIAFEELSDKQQAHVVDHIMGHQKMAEGAAGSRRLGSEVDEVLGGTPRADGAPAVAALAPPPDLPPLPESLPELSPEQVSGDILTAIQNS